MRLLVGIVAAWLVLLASPGSAQGPQVTIPGLGDVAGTTARSEVDNRQFYQFRGIPFATPPVGALRFQPPGLATPWQGVLNATRNGPSCPQLGPIGARTWPVNVAGEDEPFASDDIEDCLYIHVHTPTLAPGAMLPVIVFFHGGAWRIGSADFYGSARFMDQDVVLVIPHYRLGPLGFLSLQTDSMPGNAAMLDQVAALQWVKQNIGVFGGNPNQVTVMGESAGAASASMLAISPLSTGLFQQFIAQSGSAAADWAVDREPERAATEIGRLAGCTDPEVNALTACLMAADPTELLIAHDKFQRAEVKEGRPLFGGCAPVVQTAGSVRFLEQDPVQILEEGSYVHKPALLGSNKHEGTLVYAYLYKLYLEPNGLLEDENYFYREVTKFFLEFFGVKDQGETVAAGIEKAYFGQENMGNLTAMVPGIVDFLGNMFLKGPVFDNANHNAKFADTYMYSFKFFGDSSLWGLFGIPEVIPGGVAHANELILLFNFPGFLLDASERAMSRKMVKLWTNFATYGEPTPAGSPVEGVPSWPRFEPTEGLYMRLDESFEVRQDYTSNEYFVAAQENFPYAK